MSSRPLIAVYCGPLDGGSTAKIAARLANGFAARGVATDLLVTTAEETVPERVDPGVNIVSLGRMAALTRVPRMALYLLRRRPAAVLTHRIRENRAVLDAVRVTGRSTPVFVTVHGRMSVKLDHLPGAKARRRRADVLHYYRLNRGVIAISPDTAEDMHRLLGPEVPIITIPNPIVGPELTELAAIPVEHQWLRGRAVPVVVFAGRLEREKDLPTLLRAFKQLRSERECRLLIIGDGGLRAQTEADRAKLGLVADVDLLGWVANPYPYLQAADLVVLTSVWDALPTVLIEALALGTPVVSTDCGAGPREILQDGRLGPLVPPGDAEALARAMADTLASPLPAEILREGALRYDSQRNADLYLDLMIGGSTGKAAG